MKSCVLFFFFLVSLISSNTAPPPPGIKLQFTENAKDVLKDLGLMYLKGLVNKEFPIDKIFIPIGSVKLIELQVDPAKVDFSFQENIGLQIEIEDMTLSLEIQRKLPVFKFPWNRFYQFLFDQFCLCFRPIINYMLRDLPMMKTVHEDRQLDLDYSLSSDIAVKSRSIDISFKGLISVHGQAVDTDSIRAGKEPVFTETNKMIYVGISEFFFNGAAIAIYNSGPFEVNVPKLEGWKSVLNPGLEALGIKPGLWTVELTEAPIIEINKTRPSATVNFKAQHKDQQKDFLMKCEFNMDVGFKERLLIVNIQKIKCKDEAGKIIDGMRARVVNLFHQSITKWLVKEIPIPLPAELSIIDAKTQFEEGYLVVGGSLTFNPQSSSNAGG